MGSSMSVAARKFEALFADALWNGDEAAVAALTPLALGGVEVIEENPQAAPDEKRIAGKAWAGYGNRHDHTKRVGGKGRHCRKKAV